MMSNDEIKEEAKQNIKKLVERFRYNFDVYKKSTYNETQVRIEFIDPFFEAMGWDVGNKQDHAEQYKDVVHEDAIKIGGSTKAPDYSFRIGGQRKFFIEAKKPSVNIKEDVSPSYQLRRYAWSAKLPLSIVTDFEEFSVFDCRIKPNQTDKVSVGRIAYYTFEEYLDKFDEIYDIFSKEAILKGSFDRHVQSTKGKRGTAEVDSEFLKEIERWRELLAKNIALRNPDVSIYELNYAVQKIIDRIIFLRICEDRGIEPYGQLQPAAESTDVYIRLLNHFKLAESKYNSGIFDFGYDKITPALKIDDKVLKTIMGSLYYPISPYEFSVLGVEILGNVYEQFLGKVIRLTAGHQAKVETKPEVKKAGGVYYTPQYIVDYIVKNTVGKLVEGKTPEEIAEITILDPACGSGSFLIGAYSYLLQYHLNWYMENKPKKHKKAVFQVKKNEWYLTTVEKKRILLNNIYGVDIDSQAVEVTKLSLQLKVLENENRESIDQQVKLGMEGVLPNIGGNIKCGNSLIGPDFYDTGQMRLFDEDEMRQVNVFDWADEVKGFGEIMGMGGFDCVIGNPPYVRIQTLQDTQPEAVKYFRNRYKSGGKGNFDIYALFVEQGYSLVNKTGLLGCILPHKFFQASFGEPLREIISKNKAIYEIVHFGAEQVFKNATTYTCLLFLSKKQEESFRYVAVEKLENPIELVTKISEKIQSDCYQEAKISQPLLGEKWEFYGEKTGVIINKLKKQRNTLGNITRKIFVGLQTSADKIYVLKIIEWKENTVLCYSKSLEREIEIEKSLVKPFLMGKDVHRYDPPVPQNVVIFPYKIQNGKAELMTQKFIQEIFPLGWNYLIENKTTLENREKGKMRGDKFYAYGRLNNLTEFEAVKLMTPEIALGCQLSFDSQGVLFHTTKVYSFIFQDDMEENELFFLGVLNSKLLWFFLKATGYTLRGGYFTFKTEYLKPFPIRTIDFSNPEDVAKHDKLVVLVDNMLELHKKRHETRMERDKELYERQIKIVDAQIAGLVYDLYGLTEEEIKVVEVGV